MTQRNTPDTIDWLRINDTAPELGYNPDGMCLAITRNGRNIAPKYPSAFAAMVATPVQFRVYSIASITKGMVVYFDDESDSNPYGHIVTCVGRVKGADRTALSSLLVRTNSVVSGKTVIVRGDYFKKHWGDDFQFAATWLNGVELDLPDKPTQKPPRIKKFGQEKLEEMIGELNQLIRIQMRKSHNERTINALKRDRRELIQTLETFGRTKK